VGTEITVSLVDGSEPVDLTGLTTTTIKIQRPDRTVVSITAAAVGSLVDGVIKGTVATGTFTVRGNYTIQAYLVIGTWSGHSQSAKIRVNEVVPNA
jgi:hypothetical protein